MKAKIIGRTIVLGTVLILAVACNPLASSFGVPDFLKGGHSTHWYESTVSHQTGMEVLETGGACQHAIAMADKANPRKLRVKKIEVTITLKGEHSESVTCRVKI
jgi:hypothetical protein